MAKRDVMCVVMISRKLNEDRRVGNTTYDALESGSIGLGFRVVI